MSASKGLLSGHVASSSTRRRAISRALADAWVNRSKNSRFCGVRRSRAIARGYTRGRTSELRDPPRAPAKLRRVVEGTGQLEHDAVADQGRSLILIPTVPAGCDETVARWPRHGLTPFQNGRAARILLLMGAFAVVAHRSTPTNRRLGTVMAPGQAVIRLHPGDVALGRLDVLESLDGIERGWGAVDTLPRRGGTGLNDSARPARAPHQL